MVVQTEETGELTPVLQCPEAKECIRQYWYSPAISKLILADSRRVLIMYTYRRAHVCQNRNHIALVNCYSLLGRCQD